MQQERLDIEEKYSSLQEAAAGKTKKLKRVWTMLMQSKSEVMGNFLNPLSHSATPCFLKIPICMLCHLYYVIFWVFCNCLHLASHTCHFEILLDTVSYFIYVSMLMFCRLLFFVHNLSVISHSLPVLMLSTVTNTHARTHARTHAHTHTHTHPQS